MRNVKRWNRQRSPKVKSGATPNALAADYGLIVLNGPSTNSLTQLQVGGIILPGTPVHVAGFHPSDLPGDRTLTFARDKAPPGEVEIASFTVLGVSIVCDYDGKNWVSDDDIIRCYYTDPPEPLVMPLDGEQRKLCLRNEASLPGQTVLTLGGTPGAIRVWKDTWPPSPYLEYGQAITNPPLWQSAYIETLASGDATIDISFTGTGPAEGYTASHSLPVKTLHFGILPDFNRDGEINTHDKDLLRNQGYGTFRFWINDDRDEGFWGTNALEDAPKDAYTGEGTSSDHNDVKDRKRNCEDDIGSPKGEGVVNGVRDMVDFFPLRIDLPPKSHTLSSSLTYKLKHADGAINIVYTPFKADNFGHWFTNVCINTPYADKFGAFRNYPPTNAPTHRVTSQGIDLDLSWLHYGREWEQESVILMCEGRVATSNPLVLEAYTNNVLFATTELRMNLSPVQEMFRYVNVRTGDPYFTQDDVRPANDPGLWLTNLNSPWNLPDDYLTPYSETKKTIIWVHGLDWDEKETPAGHSELFKRLHQSGSNARYVGVSWTSDLARRDFRALWANWFALGPIVYANDVIGAFISAPLVKDALLLNPNPYDASFLGPNTTIVAHSLGNVLISSMMTDHGVEVGNYILLNPAVPSEAYDGRAPANDSDRRNMTHPDWKGANSSQDYTEKVTAAGWSTLFEHPDDPRRHVTWDGRFSGVLEKPQMKVWQFYSTGEEILRQAEGGMPSLFNWPWENDPTIFGREWVWVFHELTKGVLRRDLATQIPRHRNAGWSFNRHYNNILGQHMSSAAADLLAVNDLIATPFFRRFDPDAHKNILYWRMSGWENPNNSTDTSWLYKPDGDNDPQCRLPFLPLQFHDSLEREKMKVHAKLLAEMIPPLSSPAGGMKLRKFTQDPNDDIPNPLVNCATNLMDYRNLTLWDSAKRPNKTGDQRTQKRWLHGDYKDAPYLLTYPLYERIKTITQGEATP